MNRGNNSIAPALYVFSVIILIGGFIVGIVLGNLTHILVPYTTDVYEFNWVISIITWASSIPLFFFFRGLSEVIELLNNIFTETQEQTKNTNSFLSNLQLISEVNISKKHDIINDKLPPL